MQTFPPETKSKAYVTVGSKSGIVPVYRCPEDVCPKMALKLENTPGLFMLLERIYKDGSVHRFIRIRDDNDMNVQLCHRPELCAHQFSDNAYDTPPAEDVVIMYNHDYIHGNSW